MKCAFFILGLILSSPLNAQQLSKEKITGKWICTKVSIAGGEELPPEMKPAAEIMIKGFTNAKFILGTDGIFHLEFPQGKPEEMSTLDFLDNKKWFFDDSKNRISIGTLQENLMHIDVTEGEGFLSFALFETPFILKMVKI